MRTLLTIDRYREGERVEHRQQWSRSFVRGLFDLLYVAHAKLSYLAPYECTDIMLQNRKIDQYFRSLGDDPELRQMKGTLAICGPSGDSSLWVPTGAYTGDYPDYMNRAPIPTSVKGENLGVVIGNGATAVDPTDRQLEKKFHHGQNGSVAVETKMDAIEAGDDSVFTLNSTTQAVGVVILPKRAFRLTKVELYVYRVGNPGNITLNVWGAWSKAGDQIGARGAAISSVAIDGNAFQLAPNWEAWTLTTPVELQPGIPYVIALTGATVDGANYIRMRYRNAGADNPDPHSAFAYTNDVTVAEPDWQEATTSWVMYRVYGTSVGEFEYGGNDIFGYTVANPNASFNIRRLFRNNSGGALTVNECGLYASGTRFMSGDPNFLWVSWAHSFCIARDLVSPGIAVADGEDLGVTYTPQITV